MSIRKVDKDRDISRNDALIEQILNLDAESLQKLLIEIFSRQRDVIPLSVFDNTIFTLNESIVKYLHENLGFSFKKISIITNKSNKTVWQLHKNATNKSKEIIKTKPSEVIGIPFEVLSNPTLSTLEIVVSYLKDEIGMSYNTIAQRLYRNYKTIWTVYKKAKTKEGKNE